MYKQKQNHKHIFTMKCEIYKEETGIFVFPAATRYIHNKKQKKNKDNFGTNAF